MKTDVQLTNYPDAKVICACGNTFITSSSKREIRVEICSACHPFYTGQMKFVDTQGRVERFMAKQQAASGQKKLQKKAAVKEGPVKSLKEMLQAARKKAKQ